MYTLHNNNVIMGAMAFQTTSLTIVNSSVYSGTYQRKHQSSASLAFVRGIHRWPVNSPHKGPVTWKNFLFDDVIMFTLRCVFYVIWYWVELPTSSGYFTYSCGILRLSLTRWGRVTSVWVHEHGPHQAMTWINAGLLLIRFWRINFCEIYIKTRQFHTQKLKMSPFCLGLDVLNALNVWINISHEFTKNCW